MCTCFMRSAVPSILLAVMTVASGVRGQEPAIVDTPGVKVLRGLTVPQFEAEMQLMTQGLGVSCGFCHARGNFAAETNPRKATARRMLEMTQTINRQFFSGLPTVGRRVAAGQGHLLHVPSRNRAPEVPAVALRLIDKAEDRQPWAL